MAKMSHFPCVHGVLPLTTSSLFVYKQFSLAEAKLGKKVESLYCDCDGGGCCCCDCDLVEIRFRRIYSWLIQCDTQ